MGDLLNHRLEPLPLHDVAVGDAERLPAFEPPDGPGDAGLVEVVAADLGREHRGERLLLLGPSPADADFLPGLGIGDHGLREMRACREDPEQDLEGPRIPLEERRGGERAPHRGDEPLECHER